MDTHKRSIVKTITFRVVASLDTMLLVYIFTGDFMIMGLVGSLEIISKIIIYYLHERVWSRFAWGK
jgi:uncharacterized membrane protein